jgi:hypothetical protein
MRIGHRGQSQNKTAVMMNKYCNRNNRSVKSLRALMQVTPSTLYNWYNGKNSPAISQSIILLLLSGYDAESHEIKPNVIDEAIDTLKQHIKLMGGM